MKSSCLRTAATAGALVVALASGAQAVVVGVTNAADINPAATASWAGLGPSGTAVASPATIPDGRGNTITASSPAGSLLRLDEGTNFNGNFSFGAPLLYLSDGGPLTLSFASPVSGGGLQIQRNSLGDFAATVTASGVDGASLGSFSRNGFSDSTEDGSAIFIGLRDMTADIAQLTFTVGGGAFAVNGPSIGSSTAVPEPPTSALVVMSVFGLALSSRAFRVGAGRKTAA